MGWDIEIETFAVQNNHKQLGKGSTPLRLAEPAMELMLHINNT